MPLLRSRSLFAQPSRVWQVVPSAVHGIALRSPFRPLWPEQRCATRNRRIRAQPLIDGSAGCEYASTRTPAAQAYPADSFRPVDALPFDEVTLDAGPAPPEALAYGAGVLRRRSGSGQPVCRDHSKDQSDPSASGRGYLQSMRQSEGWARSLRPILLRAWPARTSALLRSVLSLS